MTPCNLATSAKVLFPNKATFTRSSGEDFNIAFRGTQFSPQYVPGKKRGGIWETESGACWHIEEGWLEEVLLEQKPKGSERMNPRTPG